VQKVYTPFHFISYAATLQKVLDLDLKLLVFNLNIRVDDEDVPCSVRQASVARVNFNDDDCFNKVFIVQCVGVTQFEILLYLLPESES